MTDGLSNDEMEKAVQEVLGKIGPVKLVKSHTALLEMAHYTKPESIACKWCGSKDIMKYGIREGTLEYICRACKRKFSNNATTPHFCSGNSPLMQRAKEVINCSCLVVYVRVKAV